MKKTYVIFVLIFSLVSSLLHSQEANENTENPNNFSGLLYLGIGSASGGEDENDDTTWSIGFLFDMENDSILGFDIAGEGTMLDSRTVVTMTLHRGYLITFCMVLMFLKIKIINFMLA